ncbi:protein of unknown function [Methanoculleus bourgensis]|uniref:Uncharacterized protein n=1 Tax=Methanoculleus bourgensis TaxID=83986 RepID=A0A0X3BMX4_9EURY|nr:protein of unknown function [Methanoculleus bourgensis]
MRIQVHQVRRRARIPPWETAGPGKTPGESPAQGNRFEWGDKQVFSRIFTTAPGHPHVP